MSNSSSSSESASAATAAPASAAAAAAASSSSPSADAASPPFHYVLKRTDPSDGTEREVATIFLPQEAVEADVDLVRQLTTMGRAGIYGKICVMPDAHAGGSCSVGVAAALRPYARGANGDEVREVIVPGHIGGDIGCGMLCVPIGSTRRMNFDKLDALVRRLFPIAQGGRVEATHDRPIVRPDELARLFRNAAADAAQFAAAYRARYHRDISAHIPDYTAPGFFHAACKRWRIGCDLVLRGLGVLGSGNHFLEMNVDDERGGVHYLSVHSGSRNLGQHVLRYHQGVIDAGRKIDVLAFDREKRRLTKLHKGNKALRDRLIAEAEAAAQEADATHPPYLEGAEAYAYYFDMIFTQHYASLNREIMLTRILEGLGFEIRRSGEQAPGAAEAAGSTAAAATAAAATAAGSADSANEGASASSSPPVNAASAASSSDSSSLASLDAAAELASCCGLIDLDGGGVIETIHNYIDFKDFVLRKGAIAARADELCIVALNMRDGVLLCRGRGNDSWNQSCAHGAGRILLRKEALQGLDYSVFRRAMEEAGVHSSCVVPETLDESPLAYKDANMIAAAIHPTVEIVRRLKTVWNIKSYTKKK